MNVIASVTELVRSLRAYRVRTVSTILGVTWGTLSVILLLAFGRGIEKDMEGKRRDFGTGIAIVWGQRTTRTFEGLPRGRVLRIQEADVLALLEQIPELETVSPEYMDRERIRVGGRIHRAALSGVYPVFASLRSLRPRAGGRFLNDQDLAMERRVLFLGNRLAAGLFGDEPAVGKSVVLRGLPFTVIGVLEPKDQDRDYGGLDQDRAYLPASTFSRVFGRRSVNDFVYRARSLDVHARATDRIYEVLSRRMQFDPDDREALEIWDTTEDERMITYIFLAFHLILGGSAALTLLVGGIGVANLMFITVRQRTHEIGIQLAVGARPRTILTEVFSQTFLLVLCGGALGFCASWLVTSVVAATPVIETIGTPRISPFVVLPTILLLGITGLASGYFPARRASRLDPVAALQGTHR